MPVLGAALDEPTTGHAAGLQHRYVRSACLVLTSPPDFLPSVNGVTTFLRPCRCWCRCAEFVCAAAPEKLQSHIGALSMVHKLSCAWRSPDPKSVSLP